MVSGRLLSYLEKKKISRNGHSLPLVVTRCTTRCHSLSLDVTRCHLLYHSLSLVVPLVVIRVTRCHSLYHSLSFVVTRCTTRRYLLSLDVPLVCLFINDLVIAVLNRCLKIKEQLRLNYIVCVFDQASYCKAMELKWRYTDNYKDCIRILGII